MPGRARRGCHMFRQQTSLTEFFAVDLNGTTRLKLELFERYVLENRDAFCTYARVQNSLSSSPR
jgi:hypothetical protein